MRVGLALLMEAFPRPGCWNPDSLHELQGSKNLDSRIQAVEKLPLERQDQPAQFIPIRSIFANKLTKDDKLLLAFDALAFSQVLGREVSLGKIIHGDDRHAQGEDLALDQRGAEANREDCLHAIHHSHPISS